MISENPFIKSNMKRLVTLTARVSRLDFELLQEKARVKKISLSELVRNELKHSIINH